MTEIREEYPPNYKQIELVFPVKGNEIFAYGGIIYNPSGGEVSVALIEHEKVHFLQQELVGLDVWWKNYLHDKSFRFDQELPAHICEYRVARRGVPREQAARIRFHIADRLSSKLYGNLITRQEALRLIK